MFQLLSFAAFQWCSPAVSPPSEQVCVGKVEGKTCAQSTCTVWWTASRLAPLPCRFLADAASCLLQHFLRWWGGVNAHSYLFFPFCTLSKKNQNSFSSFAFLHSYCSTTLPYTHAHSQTLSLARQFFENLEGIQQIVVPQEMIRRPSRDNDLFTNSSTLPPHTHARAVIFFSWLKILNRIFCLL